MENWKDIQGFKGYQVSNLGRVKRLPNTSNVIKYYNIDRHVAPSKREYNRTMKEKILKRVNGNYIEIRKDKIPYRFKVDRIVNSHF